MTPAEAAAKKQKRFEFHSVVKGSGGIYWGIAVLPTVQWGELEYSDILDDSEVNLAGTSGAQEVVDLPPYVEKVLNLTNIQLDKSELTITWTYDGTRYELRLRLLSTGETDGMYGLVWWPRQGDGLVYDTLGEALYIGVDLDYVTEEMFNPNHGTLQFVGTYKVNKVKLVISGGACICMSEYFGTGFYGKAVALYLWINELSKYATLGWYSKELVGAIPGTEQVLPARVLNIYMKEKK